MNDLIEGGVAIAIISTFLWGIITIVRLRLTHKERMAELDRDRIVAAHGINAPSQDKGSLSANELRNLIRDAVQEAQAPIEKRLASLENKLSDKAPLSDALLSEPTPSVIDAGKSVGRSSVT